MTTDQCTMRRYWPDAPTQQCRLAQGHEGRHRFEEPGIDERPGGVEHEPGVFASPSPVEQGRRYTIGDIPELLEHIKRLDGALGVALKVGNEAVARVRELEKCVGQDGATYAKFEEDLARAQQGERRKNEECIRLEGLLALAHQTERGLRASLDSWIKLAAVSSREADWARRRERKGQSR